MKSVSSMVGMFGVVGIIIGCSGCAEEKAVVAVADVVAPVIEGALCSLAAKQVDEPIWEDFLCTIVGDASASDIALDGGVSTVQPQGAASFIVRVPMAEVKSFAAAHNGSAPQSMHK